MEKYEFAIEPELVLRREETSEARLRGEAPRALLVEGVLSPIGCVGAEA